ncbi:MAG: hypothetical protein QOE52_2430, partial [Mycobacterium sp.]|nr:hypothetical protein [Mycobacterium sp.]
NATPDQVRGERSGRTLVGSADHVAEQVQAKVLDAGVDGVIINLRQYTPGVVAAVGDALRPGRPVGLARRITSDALRVGDHTGQHR